VRELFSHFAKPYNVLQYKKTVAERANFGGFEKKKLKVPISEKIKTGESE
jgi:hypothetical protein